MSKLECWDCEHYDPCQSFGCIHPKNVSSKSGKLYYPCILLRKHTDPLPFIDGSPCGPEGDWFELCELTINEEDSLNPLAPWLVLFLVGMFFVGMTVGYMSRGMITCIS